SVLGRTLSGPDPGRAPGRALPGGAPGRLGTAPVGPRPAAPAGVRHRLGGTRPAGPDPVARHPRPAPSGRPALAPRERAALRVPPGGGVRGGPAHAAAPGAADHAG